MASSSIKEWLHNCIRCGNCKYIFKDYSPSCPSGDHFKFESYFASGRLWIAHGIQKGEIKWDSSLMNSLFACTTCASCEIQCLAPHRHHIIDVIEELRNLAVESLGPLPAHQKFANRIEEVHNPYGSPHHETSLADIHGLPQHASVVYFIGCTSNYREMAIRDATISLLKKARVDFTIVDEYCCGSPLLRTGQTTLVEELAEHNHSVIQSAGAMRVVTSCAGCYRTLVKDYNKLDLDLGVQVLHISQLLRDLFKEGRLKRKQSLEIGKITYHDPCHLGRHMNEYEAPRDVIDYLSDELLEMDLVKENAWCCGSGGGCKAAYNDWSLVTATKRIEQAKETNASLLVSSCPFCKRAFTDVSDDSLEILDLSELADRLT